MKKGLISILLMLLALALMAGGCSHKPKANWDEKARLEKEVVAEGYAWGDKAKANAKKNAIFEATVMAIPRSVEFTYLKVDQYSLFKRNMIDRVEDVEVVEETALPGGGYKVVVKAARDHEAMKKMRFMKTASYTLVCKGETLQARIEKCNADLYEYAMLFFLERNYGEIPEKAMGNFTFFGIEREDDGKNSLMVKASAFVGTGKGELEPRERGMVLMNAWRAMAKAELAGVKKDEDDDKPKETPQQVYQRVMKAFPNAAYAEEFAMFEISRGRINNAIYAIKQARGLNPYEMKYPKILYQLYKKKGDERAMAEVQAELEQLEAWEDDVGADITTNLQYSTEVKWTEPGGQQDESGKINFRDASDQ